MQKWQQAAKPGTGAVWNSIVRYIAVRGSEKEKLESAQLIVNGKITWKSDTDLWSNSDYWASPNETLGKAAGDCEDSAILKMMALRAAGFPRDHLYIVVGMDTATRQAHAVLVARSGGRFWVLDQRTNQVIPDEQFQFFTPVISMGAVQTWVHGYKLLGVWFAPIHRADLGATR